MLEAVTILIFLMIWFKKINGCVECKVNTSYVLSCWGLFPVGNNRVVFWCETPVRDEGKELSPRCQDTICTVDVLKLPLFVKKHSINSFGKITVNSLQSRA